MDSIYSIIDLTDFYLGRNKDVKKNKMEYIPSDKELFANSSLPEFYADFYKNNDRFTWTWEVDRNEDIVGQIKIISLQHFLNGLKAIDSNIQAEDELFEFHQLDLISNEAHCGVFIKNGEIEDRMYYNYWGEEEVADLKLNFKGYLTLATTVAGFRYWPLYLLEYYGGGETAESKRFKDHMPKLIEGMTIEKFNALIEANKLA